MTSFSISTMFRRWKNSTIHYQLTTIYKPAATCDKIINKFGRDLITFCIEYSLLISNGWCGEDKDVANFTYVSTLGNSIIDYLICSFDVLQTFKHFCIEQRSESRHFPISFCIKVNANQYINEEQTDTTMTYENDTKYMFNSETIERFRESLSTLLTDDKFQFMYSRIDNNNINANDILKEM